MFLIRLGQKMILPLLIVVSVMLIVMLQLGFIFLLLAMLPAIAAYFVDETEERNDFRVVFACNLAATIPTLTPMFISGLKFKYFDVNSTIANPHIWLFIYGGAAIGWGMIYFGRHLAYVILTIQYKISQNMLENSQERLVEEWGDQVKQLVKTKNNID